MKIVAIIKKKKDIVKIAGSPQTSGTDVVNKYVTNQGTFTLILVIL